MAQMLSKRKRPEREDYMLKEQNKVDTGIFDEKTMIYLSKFFNMGIISKLNHPIARGKEADVYLAEPGDSELVTGQKNVIVKFFRVETSSFFKMQDYLIGDRRFTKKITRRSKLGIIIEWCKKEFVNLQLAKRAGVNAPIPFAFNGSILTMSFIGKGTDPAPQLKNARLSSPAKVLDRILSDIAALYGEGIVHADVSEYNILMLDGVPYMIDFGQAVVTDHPKAAEFLRRDISNITAYFSKVYGIEKDADAEFRHVVRSGS